jgi:hypothetical protein
VCTANGWALGYPCRLRAVVLQPFGPGAGGGQPRASRPAPPKRVAMSSPLAVVVVCALAQLRLVGLALTRSSSSVRILDVPQGSGLGALGPGDS